MQPELAGCNRVLRSVGAKTGAGRHHRGVRGNGILVPPAPSVVGDWAIEPSDWEVFRLRVVIGDFYPVNSDSGPRSGS